jgi:hypothetical protein
LLKTGATNDFCHHILNDCTAKSRTLEFPLTEQRKNRAALRQSKARLDKSVQNEPLN